MAAKKSRSDYGEAIRELASPHTWCGAARKLADIGDPRALIPLLEAYESPIEGGKRCLLEAMEALGATEEGPKLFNGDPRQRSLALRMMELFGNDRHLPVLVRALSDPAEGVRAQARQALAHQKRTAAWTAVITQLADADDPKTRAFALELAGIDETDHRGQTNQR